MTTDNLNEDLIRYDILTQDALRGVISKVLEEVATAGLPGDHHFFITFETHHPGVQLSPRMRERYPREMTIVIQHSFWNLKIKETAFEIDLSFDDIRERLRIPFAAIKGFYDPSVKFGLQFDVDPESLEEVEEEDEPEITIELLDNGSSDDEGAGEKKTGEGDDTDHDGGGADVVSLDSFRNKNK